MRALSLPVLAAALVLSSAVHAGDVLVVGGPGGLPQIGVATAQAAEGDIVLVRPGSYEGFAIWQKSVSVIADAGGDVTVNGTVTVEGLLADQVVTLDGLRLRGGVFGSALVASGNAGGVWIESCVLDSYHDDEACLRAVACDSLMVRRSRIDGGQGGEYADPGAPGLHLTDSHAWLFSSFIQGGQGGYGGDDLLCSKEDGGPGGPGVLAEDSVVLVQRCELRGGRGGQGDICPTFIQKCGWGGVGGVGAHLVGTTQMTAIQSLVGGGRGGGAEPCCCPQGQVGDDYVLEGGTLEQPLGVPRALAIDSPLRESELAAAQVEGKPGESVAVFASKATGLAEPPGLYGVRLLGDPLFLWGWTTLPEDGQATLAVTVPELGPSEQGLPLRLQMIAAEGSSLFWGEAATVVLLDAAF